MTVRRAGRQVRGLPLNRREGTDAPEPRRRSAVEAPEVKELLESGLSKWLGRPARIVAIEKESVDGYSVHPISRLEVVLAGGRRIPVIFKRLQIAPGKVVRREVLLYQRLLAGQRFGAPALYASLCDDSTDRYWLFLEDVGEWRLDWCETREWMNAFRWLGRLHATYEGCETELRGLNCLGLHGPRFYYSLVRAAHDSLARRAEPGVLKRFEALTNDHFDPTVAYLSERPLTLVHGDMSGHNLIVQKELGIRPVDWEWAAIGVGAWDVVKLLAGWGHKKGRLLDVYRDEFNRVAPEPLDDRWFQLDLTLCDNLKALWYLRWWVDRCHDPAFVDGLLYKMEQRWRFAAEGARRTPRLTARS